MTSVPEKRQHSKPDRADRIEVAIQNGLSMDKSNISSDPVSKNVVEETQLAYDAMLSEWDGYVKRCGDIDLERKNPNPQTPDPRNVIDLKHFAEVVGRSTKPRIGKTATVKTVRQKMRKFMAAWERKYRLVISKDLHDTVLAYIINVLQRTIPLSVVERAPTFLTIDNYVHMKVFFWQNDNHSYIHEGVRVHSAALLNLHCYTGARLREICMAKYQDLICMVAWKDGDPEIKISFKRDFAKGMQDTPKKPKHPLYERLDPTPPLFASSVLFLLSIFISANAFRDFKTVPEVLAATPKPGEEYWIMDWEDNVLQCPVFPEMCINGPIKKSKSPNSWSTQCSDWAKRAGFTAGMGLHASRREALIKVDDSGYSLGQVMKFAGHRNPKTLVGHYLADISNVDGAAAFLNLNLRRDVTKEFRSASMKRNPDLQHSLPAKMLVELENRADYIALSEGIDNLSSRVKTSVKEEEREALKAQLDNLYYQRRKLREQELEAYQSGQRRVYKTQSDVLDGVDWRRGYFNRVIPHMVPERARLAQTLLLEVPLRSPQGISALHDLIALLTTNSRVAYQDALRPTQGQCAAPSCSTLIESIAIEKRWDHVYRCYKANLEENHGFAKFCFLHSEWITSREGWGAHCQAHIDDKEIPFRCNPVTFRRGLACAGYCPSCLGNTRLPAINRMRHFTHLSPWKQHISQCIPDYINALPERDSIPCPHLRCAAAFGSEALLWHHLGDYHSIHKPNVRAKRSIQSENIGDEEAPIPNVIRKRRKLHSKAQNETLKASANQRAVTNPLPKAVTEDSFIPYFQKGFSSESTTVIKTVQPSSASTPYCSSDESFWDKQESCSSNSTSLSSPMDCTSKRFNEHGENDFSLMTELEPIAFSQSQVTEYSWEPDSVTTNSQPTDHELPCNTMLAPFNVLPDEMLDPMLLSPVNYYDNTLEILPVLRRESMEREHFENAVEIEASQLFMHEAANSELISNHRDGPQHQHIDEGVSTEPQNHPLCPQFETIPETQMDICDEYEVEQILKSRTYYRKLQYRVKWVGYADDLEWYDASNFKNSPHKLRDFHSANPICPGPSKRQNVWIQCWEEDRDPDEHPDDNKPERSCRRGEISRA